VCSVERHSFPLEAAMTVEKPAQLSIDPDPPTINLLAKRDLPLGGPKDTVPGAIGPQGGPDRRETRRTVVTSSVITAYIGALGVLVVPAIVWAFDFADQISAQRSSVPVTWIGPDFTADAVSSALVLASIGGVTGSLVHAGHLLSRRVGRRTFESSYLTWYLLRPMLSALLGMAFVAVVRGGLLAFSSKGTDGSTPVLAFAIGALAGLFLDTVLQKLRAILGATAVDAKASEQSPPEGGVEQLA